MFHCRKQEVEPSTDLNRIPRPWLSVSHFILDTLPVSLTHVSDNETFRQASAKDQAHDFLLVDRRLRTLATSYIASPGHARRMRTVAARNLRACDPFLRS